jgi:NAD-dependent SIR2 family protein deacetylase
MRFVAGGPDIPEDVLFSQEGRLVFFRGAGVSVRAGLPLFKGLVQKLYD